MNCGTVILVTQHSSILLQVIILLFPAEDPSFPSSLPSSFSFCVILVKQLGSRSLWLPQAYASGIGLKIAVGPVQWNFHCEYWNRALFSSSRREPRCIYSETAASTCDMWVASEQQKAEQRERKRSKNLITLFESWFLPCLKLDLPLDFSNVSQKISFCV